MNIRDAFDAKAIALYNKEVSSNAVPYLGAGLFPARKKMGLDLKWIKTGKGLPVSLAPSAFDAKSTLRSREGFKMDETEMAFFRESMIVSEQDEQDIMRVQESNDPYAMEVVRHIFDDAQNLIDGADVVPERMIWQLLAPADGHPKISIESKGVTYAYNYDPANTFATTNYTKLLGTSMWSQVETADPMTDVMTAQDAIEADTGVRPSMLIVSKKTMGYLRNNKNVKNAILAQNTTANVYMTDRRVRELFSAELGVSIVVYAKQYKNESGVAEKFYPDDMATLVPAGALGNTWYGTTPEERTLMGAKDADVSVINTGVAVAVTTTNDPVHTKTTVSEIVLPSFERMDEVYVLNVASDYTNTFTGVLANGSATGTAKVTITGAAGTGNGFYYKKNVDALPFGALIDTTWTAYTSAADIACAVGEKVAIVCANTTSKSVVGGSTYYVNIVKA